MQAASAATNDRVMRCTNTYAFIPFVLAQSGRTDLESISSRPVIGFVRNYAYTRGGQSSKLTVLSAQCIAPSLQYVCTIPMLSFSPSLPLP